MVVPTPEEVIPLIQAREGFTEDPETGCWLWDDTPGSYGPFLAFFEAVFNEVPEGMVVHHVCAGARRGCVRPSHLDVALKGELIPEAPVHPSELHKFAKRIREEREARRYSRARMARYIGVSPPTLTSWENGKSKPNEDLYRQLSTQMGWDGKPRKWIVTCVQQRVLVGESAGEAARLMWEGLEIEGEQLKTELISVRPV